MRPGGFFASVEIGRRRGPVGGLVAFGRHAPVILPEADTHPKADIDHEFGFRSTRPSHLKRFCQKTQQTLGREL